MDAFYERLIVRAATIDELLSDAFEPLPGEKGDADLAARRFAAWCQSCRQRRRVAVRPAARTRRLVDRAGAQALRRGPPQRRRSRRRRGSPTPSGSRRRCKARQKRHADHGLGCERAVARSNSCSRRSSSKPRRGCGRVSTTRVSAISANPPAPMLAPVAARGAVRPLRRRRSTSASPRRASAARRGSLRSIRRRHESRRLPPPVRRQAGAVAADCRH